MVDEKSPAPKPVSTTPAPAKPWPMRRYSEITPVPVQWLWHPYLMRGAVNCIAGDPGMGKSWISCAITAALTTGRALPGQEAALPPQNVIILSAEDGPDNTIWPRLNYMGADLSRVWDPTISPNFSPQGIRELESSMREAAATIVFVDPVQAYIDTGIDIHKANQVRQIMKPLAAVAKATGSAVVLIMHLRKKQKGQNKEEDIHQVLGSIDFIAAVRSAMFVGIDRNSNRYMSHIKCNNAKLGPAHGFRFDDKGFEWTGPYTGPGPKVVVSKTPRGDTLQIKAKAFLSEVLAGGPLTAHELILTGLTRGFTKGTLHLAKEGVAITYPEAGEWFWRLATQGEQDANFRGIHGPA